MKPTTRPTTPAPAARTATVYAAAAAATATRPAVVVLAALVAGCVSAAAAAPTPPSAAQAPPKPVAPAPPPKDDGQPAKGGQGGLEHAAALEELKTAPLDWRDDRQSSLRLLLPDSRDWLRVKFWGVQSLVGFRYGKDHHAIVAGFVVHVPDETVQGACGKAFEAWAQPYADAFEVEIARDPPKAFPWAGKIVDVDSFVATTATLGDRDEYVAAYAAYPAWKGACVVVGIAVPARNELERAKAVRDRFAAMALPTLVVTSTTEPKQ
jgi:hypothetical protein